MRIIYHIAVFVFITRIDQQEAGVAKNGPVGHQARPIFPLAQGSINSSNKIASLRQHKETPFWEYLTRVRRTFGKHLEGIGDPLENAQRELDIASPCLNLYQNGPIGGWDKEWTKRMLDKTHISNGSGQHKYCN
jgi:hypothetical protein